MGLSGRGWRFGIDRRAIGIGVRSRLIGHRSRFVLRRGCAIERSDLFDARRHRILIHVLDLIDEDEWIALIKNRYERLLMEIFE